MNLTAQKSDEEPEVQPWDQIVGIKWVLKAQKCCEDQGEVWTEKGEW